MGLRDASLGQSERSKVIMVLWVRTGNALFNHTLGSQAGVYLEHSLFCMASGHLRPSSHSALPSSSFIFVFPECPSQIWT